MQRCSCGKCQAACGLLQLRRGLITADPQWPTELPPSSSSSEASDGQNSSASTATGGSQASIRMLKVKGGDAIRHSDIGTGQRKGEVVPDGSPFGNSSPESVWNKSPESATAGGAEGVVPVWAPSEEELESEDTWGVKLRKNEPAVSPAGLEPDRPREEKLMTYSSFISASMQKRNLFQLAGLCAQETALDVGEKQVPHPDVETPAEKESEDSENPRLTETLKEDVEWHLLQADFEAASRGSVGV